MKHFFYYVWNIYNIMLVVHKELICHVDIWQKSTQYCKAIILQLKINLLIEKEKNRTDLVLKGDNGESDPLRP